MVTGKLMRLLLAWGAMAASQVLSEKTNEETLLEEKNTDRDTSGMGALGSTMANKFGSKWQRLLQESKTKEDGNTVESTDEHESKWEKLDTDEKIESTIIKWGKYNDLKKDPAKDIYTNQKKSLNNVKEDQKKHSNTFETDKDIDDHPDGHMYPDSTWKDKQYVPQSKANKENKKSETIEQKTIQSDGKETIKNSEIYEEKPGAKLLRSKCNHRKPKTRKLRDWLQFKSEKENKHSKVGKSMQLTKGHETKLKKAQYQLERKWHRPDKNDDKHGKKEQRHMSIIKKIHKDLGEKTHGLTHHIGEHGSKHHNGKHGFKQHNGDHGSKHHNGEHENVDPLFKLKVQHKKRWPSAIRLR